MTWPTLSDSVAGGGGAFVPAAIASYTWAAKPAASSYGGAVIRITDVGPGQSGTGGGNYFMSNGVRWKPINGECRLDGVDSANVGTAVATEQVLTPNRVAIPAGVILDFDRLELRLSVSKSAAAETCTLRVKLGTTGTAADTTIATITTLAGANQSFGAVLVFKRLTATTIQKQGNADTSSSFNGPATGAYPAAVAVSSMDSSVLYLTITAQMSVGAEIPTLQDMSLNVQSTDNS